MAMTVTVLMTVMVMMLLLMVIMRRVFIYSFYDAFNTFVLLALKMIV